MVVEVGVREQLIDTKVKGPDTVSGLAHSISFRSWPTLFMNASSAIADSLLRRAFGGLTLCQLESQNH
jgi:hypothetical protein